ncbi:MAG: AmmeMemoRadiSam system radical SAM enzyme [Desulfuromonadales bacterium]
MKREALLYQRHDGGAVTCLACQRRCLIPQGRTGWCRTRVNEGGRLFSLIYGEVSSASVNPIEKKPVFHFLPGTRWLSLGSVGCNFRCPGCQNWEIAHWREGPMYTEYIAPEKSVAMAEAKGCAGISWTFNEPSLWWEYTLDAAKIAGEKGLYTNYVTNGTLTAEAFDRLAPFLDVYRVDIKGFSQKTYRALGHLTSFSDILRITEKAKENGMHVEVVTNVIPAINDSDGELRDIAAWIRDALGPETPWHLTRYYPQFRLQDVPPTPVARLESAREIGREAGLWYVYLGNVPGHEGENTWCHHCGTLLIERFIFEIVENRLVNGRCPQCGTAIPGRF